MAGFRTFATGEVLTAANVNNFLMKQSVMVFADASARTTALGAEVVEGMLTYNEDTAQLEVFDGSAFVPAGAEPPAGIGSNVVQVEIGTTFNTSSDTFVVYTGVTLSFTPSTATSKVLLLATGTTTSTASNRGGIIAVFRGGTKISQESFGMTDEALENGGGAVALALLDSPGSAAAQTYDVRVRRKNSFGTARFFFANLIAIEVAP